MGRLARSVLVLAAGNLLNRFLGTAYRLLLVRFLGGEGLGLFQMALSVYFALVQPFAGSLPAALSQVLAASRAGSSPRPEDRRVLAATTALSLLAALAAAWGLTRVPAAALGDAWRLTAELLPLPLLHATLACAVASAALRGLLLAYGRVAAIALAQTGEQVLRIAALAAVLAAWTPALDLAARVRLVLWNLLAGEAVDLLLLLAATRRLLAGPWPWRPPGRRPTLGAVVRLALPIALQRGFFSLEHLLEAALIPRVLQQAGLGPGAALAAYGAITGVAAPLLYLPMVAVGALTQVLVPEVAALADRPAARAGRVRAALALAAEAGGAAAVGLLLAGPELARLIYGADASGPLAAQVVRGLAPLALFLYLDAAAAAALRGAGRATDPLAVDVAAAVVRLGLLLVMARSGAGLPGVAAVLVASEVLACALNLALAVRALGLEAGLLARLALPGGTALASVALVRAAAPALPPPARLLAGIAAYGLLRLLAWRAARG